jgi:GTP-binding protein HflX
MDFASEGEHEDPDEFEELVISAGAQPVGFVRGQRSSPTPRFFVGEGKVEEIREQVVAQQVDVVLFNHALRPSQERNLEKALQCRVLDRTGLILDIFAQRARTHEGKLQVELAQLQHMSTRLIRGWTHLERQKGGIGLRGPGETQLETDRRLIRGRIKAIENRLEKVQRQRQQGRRARQRADTPTVSVVGYTNAGKSTLFNTMTQADVYAADQLFATLDPTMRRISVTGLGAVVLADTVGFIRHLPHKLIEAFRATLEEAAQADLLLHVIDIHADERLSNIEHVKAVLDEIGAGEVPVLEVYNKIDLVASVEPHIERDDDGRPQAVYLSALTGAGVDLLPGAIADLLGRDVLRIWVKLAPAQARLRARLYAGDVVQEERSCDDGTSDLALILDRHDLARLLKAENIAMDAFLADARPL